MKTLSMTPASVAALVASERVEESRITLWLLVPLPVRALLLTVAGLPRERAGDDLMTFTARERGKISLEAQRLMTDMAVAEQCMRDTAKTTVLH